jgi:DNA polymerase-3 subunit delta
MPITYNRFIKGLKKSKDQIFFFNGDENFLKDNGVLSIIDKYNDKYDKDFDFLEYYGKNINSDELATELVTTPMISDYRLIIIYNIDKCEIKTKNIIKKWLDQPNKFIIFISTTSEQISLKNTTQFFQKLSEVSSTVSCYKLEDKDMKQWIIEKLKESNKTIEESAVEYLVDMVGSDLYKMSNELKKIVLYLNSKEDVKINDVRSLVSDVRSDNIFDLVDSIISKDLKKSIRMSKNVIREGGDAIALVSLLYRKLMQGAVIVDMIKRHIDDNRIRESLGLSPYALMQTKEKLDQISKLDIFKLFRKLLDTDIDLKSNHIDVNVVVENLIIEFCS